MSQTYSTLQREVSSERVYSSGRSRGKRGHQQPGARVISVRAVPIAPQAAPVERLAPVAAPVDPPVQQSVAAQPATAQPAFAVPAGLPAAVQAALAAVLPSAGAAFPPETLTAAVPSATFALTSQGLPAAAKFAPNATGVVTVSGAPGQPLSVTGSLTGLQPLSDQSIRPTLWLIHDLAVPTDLNPADVAQLPRGSAGFGNQPGSVFTLDGNPPTGGCTIAEQGPPDPKAGRRACVFPLAVLAAALAHGEPPHFSEDAPMA